MHDDDHYRDNAAMGSHSPYTSYDVPNAHFKGVQLIADPIHGYIPFTVPLEPLQGEGETAESDLIDTPWMQRLRAIAQLQSARWVFPAAEHSRFQHSLGTMHIAGRFAQALYPTLCEVEPGCPSRPYIESLLRISGLLHDLGHGPLCHFFDDHYLSRFAISHEMIGHRIILQVLADIISRIRRSPSGAFASHETLEPRYVAYLMQKKLSDDPGMPRWLRLLKPVLAGVYTADNLDYVLRDAYMCGVSMGPVDLDRLLHYSFITEHGLTLHTAGIGALTMFLTARHYLYTHVYWHRTARAIDLHLQELFPDTMNYIFPWNPLERLDDYLWLTDWSLLETVRRWTSLAHAGKRHLGGGWDAILKRRLKWKMACDATADIRHIETLTGSVPTAAQFMHWIHEALPHTHRHLEFKLDIISPGPRHTWPNTEAAWPLATYDPLTGNVHARPLATRFEHIPKPVTQYRIYTTDHAGIPQLARTCETVLAQQLPSRIAVHRG
jgi:HD superfamily phosphohydrolase